MSLPSTETYEQTIQAITLLLVTRIDAYAFTEGRRARRKEKKKWRHILPHFALFSLPLSSQEKRKAREMNFA